MKHLSLVLLLSLISAPVLAMHENDEEIPEIIDYESILQKIEPFLTSPQQERCAEGHLHISEKFIDIQTMKNNLLMIINDDSAYQDHKNQAEFLNELLEKLAAYERDERREEAYSGSPDFGRNPECESATAHDWRHFTLANFKTALAAKKASRN